MPIPDLKPYIDPDNEEYYYCPRCGSELLKETGEPFICGVCDIGWSRTGRYGRTLFTEYAMYAIVPVMQGFIVPEGTLVSIMAKTRFPTQGFSDYLAHLIPAHRDIHIIPDFEAMAAVIDATLRPRGFLVSGEENDWIFNLTDLGVYAGYMKISLHRYHALRRK